jgi:SAM-dependent methyltransferase
MVTTPLQRDVFLSGEGDAWFQRNRRDQPLVSATDDPLLPALLDIPLEAGAGTSVVEVGCGQGLRLHTLAREKGWLVHGLDPSAEAVAAATELGVDARVGTAEQLPYASRSVDLLIFGFCLYLCDRDDLFQIAAEAHRVLKPSSWLAILDFWSPWPRSNPYCHRPGLQSYKSNLPEMFLWNPSYIITDHRVRHHGAGTHTDDVDELVAATVIRKCNDFGS